MRKIHEELRRAVLDAWMHGGGWCSPLTRSMYGQYGRHYEVASEAGRRGVSVQVWGRRVAQISRVWDGGKHPVWLYDGGVPSALTRDALQAVSDALGINAVFHKHCGEIVCVKDGKSFPVPSCGVRMLWS